MPKTKELKPIRLKSEYAEVIEKAIAEALRKEIYIPLMKEIGVDRKILKNSYQDLIDAISSGQIQYVNGHFEGSFNSAISKELRKLGATWNRRHGVFSIPQSKLTNDMRTAIGTSFSKFQNMANKLESTLSGIIPEQIASKLKISKILDATIYKVNKEFEDSIKGITVAPTLTPDQVNRIKQEYTQNMQLYITDFAQKEILKLRIQVQENAMSGVRYESMIKTIKDSYGVSKNKARFLARQETNLMVTKFHQVRCEDAGVREYKWKTVVGSPLHPVRPMHKALDGKIFTWDNPPIVNDKGEHKNPGQDYGCRCIAIPVVKFK